ncbi:MAG TPA: lysylphosphatidylglycerol synthase transmembrane domain-containing protein, partial [Pedococcus sp.]|nr:lysylphosphatidylglycerol synthase transmembrane domain-containing protein [Pedococcus sp.]
PGAAGAGATGSEVVQRRRGSRARRIAQMVLGLALAAALLVWGLPFFAKTSWADVFEVLGSISGTTAAGLLLLVLVGLYSYTFTLTGSLHGLRHYQALIVNVCGSSVGNLLPGGGAAGLAVTYTICRSWGFSRRDISTSAIVTGVWNVLARVALPVVAIVALTAGAENVPAALRDAAIAASISGVAILGVFVSVLASERAAVAIGHGIDRAVRPLTRRRGRTMSVRALVIDLRARINEVVRRGWLQMTLGLAGYFATYFVLFLLCLRITGVEMYYGQVFAAYAIGRLLTAVGVTPGGLGVTETATAAALVAWGAHPAHATAAVVVFSVYTHLMEIPLGALGWVAWSLSPKQPTPEHHSGAAEEASNVDGASVDGASVDGGPGTRDAAAPGPATSPDGEPGAAGPGQPPRHPG